MDFITLCRDVARESGTVNNGGLLPLTTIGQGGRLGKIVSWTRDAWVEIQNRRPDWRWMKAEFEGGLLAAVPRYTPLSLGIETRFRAWAEDRHGYKPLSLYDPAIGVADEGALRQVSWETWRHTYGRGAQPTGKPAFYAISPRNELCVGGVPDRIYAVRGEYYRSAQMLEADGDVPEMPEQYHKAIVWHAVMMLHHHDEAATNAATAALNADSILRAMTFDQLPEVTVS